MNKQTFLITSSIFSATLIFSTVVFANVIDLENITDVDRFFLDRACGDSRDFSIWINDQLAQEERRDQWCAEQLAEIAQDFSDCFDPIAWQAN